MSDNHRRALLIAPDFPPAGGGGVIRATKMAKYLGEYGYDVVVLTKPPAPGSPTDYSLLADVPPSVEVIRFRGVDPYMPFYRLRARVAYHAKRSGGALEIKTNLHAIRESSSLSLFRLFETFVRRYIAIPDFHYWWARSSVDLAEEIIHRRKVSLIWSTSTPYSSHLLGLRLKEKTGLPWIADFRDVWTADNMFYHSLPKWKMLILERLEYLVLANTDIVTTVTPTFVQNFKSKFGNVIRRIALIYNGFDLSDFTEPEPVPDNSHFITTHAGKLDKTRDPGVWLSAIADLIDEGRVFKDSIVVRFIGPSNPQVRASLFQCIQHRGLEDIVQFTGSLPHDEAISALRSSDLLLLIGDALPGAGAYIPGKLYEYIATGRPIFALVGRGEAERIIERYRLGCVAPPTDKGAIKEFYMKMYERWCRAEVRSNSLDLARLKIFDRRFQALQLGRLMDDLVSQ
jgi:glycosyltransferase involved in cell wall biosynthesis